MDTNYILSAMKASEPNIAYEVTLPRWATEKIESKFYLLELEFLAIKGGNEIPFSEAIGLGENLATQVGIVWSHSVYSDGCNV